MVRIDAEGNLRESKPCYHCLSLLKKSRRFRFCYYSNAAGKIVKIRMADLTTTHVSRGFRNLK